MGKKIVLKETFSEADRGILIDFLKASLPLSGGVLKECLIQGSCWVKKGNSKALKRVRRAKTEIRRGDKVELHYDPKLFELQKKGLEQEPILVKKEREWSAWYKPAGVLTQGNKYGDSLSLLRFAEKELKAEPYLIHRLDRETDGVVVLAHNPKAAKLLSAKWQGTLVEKIYHAWVLGEVEEDEGRINFPLEGKKALTFYKVLEKDEDRSYLELKLGTGRTHQIRKHLEMLGHPIMGDPKYGKGNKNHEGMQLRASQLVFDFKGEKKDISVPKDVPPLIACYY